MDGPSQFELLRAVVDTEARLRRVGDARKALVYGLRQAKEVFQAPEAALAILRPGRAEAELAFTLPPKSAWELGMLSAYLRGERPAIPWTIILAPVLRKERNWAALALRNRQREFAAADRDDLFLITDTLTEAVRILDERQVRSVRLKIERKIANRRDPKDLIYDILHGLRSLTHYDHSASLFISRSNAGPLELVAEQIAWTKAKSGRIGHRVELDDVLREQIHDGGIEVFTQHAGSWSAAAGGANLALPQALSFDPASGAAREVAMLCAPIATPDGTLGLLKISARREGVLGAYEVGLVEGFMPLASLAIQFSVRTESLQKQVLKSERRHALANLSRGITHDINSALGATLPLVQQLRDDARAGRVKDGALEDDLSCIEESIQTCRRIFGGMLAAARGGMRSGPGHANLRRAVEAALGVLEDSLKKRAINVVREIPQDLPAVRGGQADLTQLFLNLCTNARDAMPNGGELTVLVEPRSDDVLVAVRDTGCGIPAAELERILEPFFTTKTDGNGLGLSICRSILRDVGGDIHVESQVGQGTCIRLRLPVFAAGQGDA
ncbi:MAG: hypothetical protein GF355_03325 [Candidatus Eisenbacteria bacterium]|nr:hypothetical protein [Candidatus Eisenbacteria bacterium]